MLRLVAGRGSVLVLQNSSTQSPQEIVNLRFHIGSRYAVARLDLTQELLTFTAHNLRVIVNVLAPFHSQRAPAQLPAAMNSIPIHFALSLLRPSHKWIETDLRGGLERMPS